MNHSLVNSLVGLQSYYSLQWLFDDEVLLLWANESDEASSLWQNLEASGFLGHTYH